MQGRQSWIYMTGQMDEPEQAKTLNSEPRETTTLYRPIGAQELALIEASGFTRFPPRLLDQPFFYPVLLTNP